MMGSGDDLGVIPLMNQDLFERLQSVDHDTDIPESERPKFLITVSFLEIYNEVVKDLLNPSDKVCVLYIWARLTCLFAFSELSGSAASTSSSESEDTRPQSDLFFKTLKVFTSSDPGIFNCKLTEL